MRSYISILFHGDHVIMILLNIDQQLNLKVLNISFLKGLSYIKISFCTLYVINKIYVIDPNVNATDSRNQNTSTEAEILAKNDLIRNQETTAQQVHIVEVDTKFIVAEEENNESANKDKDISEKDSYIPHVIEEKREHSFLPTIDTKGDQLCL